MDCPGEYLKRERELREVSLEDISSEIKVSVRLLKALEADDYQALPHTAFVKGFIKAYCKYLGVDGNEALLRYELYLQEVAEFEEPAKKPKSLDVAERSYPVRKFLTLTLVAIGIIIIAGVYYFGSAPEDKPGDKVVEKVTGEKPPAAAYVKEEGREGAFKVAVKVDEVKPAVEPEAKPEVGSEALSGAEIAKATEESEELRIEKSVPVKKSVTKSPEVAAVAAEEVAVEEKDEAPAFVALPALGAEELAKMELAPGEHLLRAHARALTWMKVTIDSNAPFEVMLQPNERVEWRGKVFFCS